MEENIFLEKKKTQIEQNDKRMKFVKVDNKLKAMI